MLYAVISDIHANAVALEAVIGDAVSKGVTGFICLGDVVGYGPMPDETVSLVRKTCAVTLAGNHDDAVSGRMDADRFIDLAQDAVERHRESLSGENLAWLKNLPYTYAAENFAAVHGDFTDPGAFEYIDDPDAAKANFAAVARQLLFCGHTHEPGVFLVGGSGNVYRLGPTDFALEEGKRYIVNPGSVGYPRESGGKCLSSYVIYDSFDRAVTFHFVPFTVSSVMQRGRNPRRMKKRTLAAAALVLSAAIGAGVYFLAPRTEVELNVSYDPQLVVKSYTLEVPPGAGELCPALELDWPTDHVILKYVFKTRDSQIASSGESTVKRSCKRGVPVPPGAHSVVISVSKTKKGDDPAVESFKPYFR